MLLTDAWVERLQAFDQLLVGFSGGLDSTVLLHALATHPVLRNRLQAVHIHHGLSPHAASWQEHCANFCVQHGVLFTTHHVNLPTRSNLEEQARNARLRVFSSLLQPRGCLLLAHHQDDQAETVLLQLCRGTGVDGLAGIPSSRPFSRGEVVRPLLDISRKTLQTYAHAHALTWIEDESNTNSHFSRNYLRHEVIPVLQARWPAVARMINTCATHCQQAKHNLDDLAYIDCPELVQKSPRLALSPLAHLSSARISNVLRVWVGNQGARMSAKRVDRLLSEVILAGSDRNPVLQWGECCVRRYRDDLYWVRDLMLPVQSVLNWTSFPGQLPADKCIQGFQAQLTATGIHIPVGSRVEIRFRNNGETMVWRGKTRTLKKLFQEWGVPPWLREHIPLIYVNDELAAVLDFCISDLYYGAHSESTYTITRSTHQDDAH